MRRQRTPGVTSMVVGAVCFVALLVAYTASGRLVSGEVVTAWAGNVTLVSDDELTAGTATSVVVSASVPDGTIAQLAIFAPLDTAVLSEPVVQGTATFTIDSQIMRQSGLYRLVAKIENSSSATHEVRVSPLAAVDPIVPLVGPRTIIADGSDTTMTVLTPIDRFGNPVADGTPVEIEIVRPDGQRTTVAEQVTNAIAAIVLESTTDTGRVTISASSERPDGTTVDGPTNVVDQVAGAPSPFTIELAIADPLADGFALYDVQTSELRDPFGNLLPDGVSAVFIAVDSGGTSWLQATVQNGIARTLIEAPPQPGSLTLTARVGGVESAPVVVEFTPAVTSFTATKQSVAEGTSVSVGPVVTERGGYVADGTTATIYDRNTGDEIARTALRGGVAQIVLDDAPADIDVEVLGARLPVEEP